MNCTALSLGLILFLTTSDAPLDAARAPVAEPLAQTDDEDSVAHDVEVMRTLLVKSIDASGGMSVSEFKDVSGTMAPGSIYLSNLAGDLVQGPPILVTHSRGFRVPGTGVIYSMDVQIPARAIAEVSAATEQPIAGSPMPRAPNGFCGSAISTAPVLVTEGTSR